MTALEQVMNMKKQGTSEDEIIRTLQNQGVSPKEISDALTQSQIKQAVSQENQNTQGMEPSIMGATLSEVKKQEQVPVPESSSQEIYSPQMPQEQTQDTFPQIQNPAQQDFFEGEEYYPQEETQDYSDYETTSGGMDSIIEISEQVFLERIKKVQDKINDFLEFRTLHQSKMNNMEERLKRIEKMFDQMQISIIEKVGTYGKGLETLKKELNMVEDSFSKIVNKVIAKNKTTSKKR